MPRHFADKVDVTWYARGGLLFLPTVTLSLLFLGSHSQLPWTVAWAGRYGGWGRTTPSLQGGVLGWDSPEWALSGGQEPMVHSPLAPTVCEMLFLELTIELTNKKQTKT